MRPRVLWSSARRRVNGLMTGPVEINLHRTIVINKQSVVDSPGGKFFINDSSIAPIRIGSRIDPCVNGERGKIEIRIVWNEHIVRGGTIEAECLAYFAGHKRNSP